MTYKIICGDNREVLKQFPDNHFDSIVTDPPYGIDFLGKAWDATTGALETYQECLRVLKPGGHVLAFSAARTYHHLAYTLERAGFEIRDQIMWIYSSGFPKSQDVGRSIQRSLGVKETKKNNNHRTKAGDSLYESGHQKKEVKGDVVCSDPEAKQWEGWGTQLKPAHEPICMARKPLYKDNSIARNCQQWGVGALNIDATRIEGETLKYPADGINRMTYNQSEPDKWAGDVVVNDQGRFPSNVIGEIPDYQKYFYCPKVSRKERHMGFDLSNIPTNPDGMFEHGGGDLHAKQAEEKKNGNNHPTVKPIELMKYLIKLITPPNGRVLDPFNGSGSTGMAAVELGHEYTGIELDPKYVEIAQRRIEAWNKPNNTFDDIFEEEL